MTNAKLLDSHSYDKPQRKSKKIKNENRQQIV